MEAPECSKYMATLDRVRELIADERAGQNLGRYLTSYGGASFVAPVVPALRDSLRAAARGRLESHEDPFNVPGTIISQLLSSCGQAEAAVTMLAFAVSASSRTTPARPGAAAELLRNAGIRALELGDSTAFEQILDRLDALTDSTAGTSDVPGVTGMLAATACRFDARLSQRAADRALAQLAADQAADAPAVETTGPGLIVLWRAGAAGLGCGAMSVAVHAAETILQAGARDSLIAMASDRALISSEAIRSDFHGRYLGDQAQDSLANFGTFLADLAPVLT
jgi:hypothetical protein